MLAVTDSNPAPRERGAGREIWHLAWPVMLTHALFTALHIVDMFWVGRLGPAAVAATALSGSVVGVLFAAGQVFTVGAMATASRAAGGGRADAVRDSLRHALALAFIASLPLAALGVAFARPVLGLFGPEPPVIAAGAPYLQVALGTIPLFFCGMICYTVFQAVGDTRTPMFVIAGSNALNAALDPLLIFGLLGFPRLGLTGAAVATACSMSLGLAVMLLLMRRRGLLGFRGGLRPRLFRTLLAIGAPAGLQGITRPLTGMLLFRIVTGFGTAATAAFGIGLRVLDVMFIYLGGLGVAAEVLTGQSLGAERPDLARRYSGRVTLVAVLLQVAVLPLLFIFAPAIVRAFNADPEVVRVGTGYLRILTPMLIVGGLSIGWAGAQRGAGATALPMVAALVANWAVKLPLAAILARHAGLGTTGVWLGIGVSVVIESIILAGGYYSYRWQHRRVEWH
ncbi:MAG: MATE family efflux transporter [bacterium]